MIVRSADDGILLIAQPDHAHLARRIMEHCVPLKALPRREAVLHAIEEHDNGWAETDAAPAVDPRTGGVADFVNAPLGVRHGVWPRAVARLAADPWAAALVAHHAVTVYNRFRSDPAWTMFFGKMEGARDRMLRSSRLPFEDLVHDYPFVRLADLISLTFCTGWTDEQRFGGWTVQLTGTRVVVTPDPFGEAIVPVEIEARKIRHPPYRSDAELQAAVSGATPATLRGDVAGPRRKRASCGESSLF